MPHERTLLPAEAAPSFRVYTPRELGHVTLRPARRPPPERGLGEELKASLDDTVARVRTTRPLVLVTWVGVVLTSTLCLFAVLLAVANATDDLRLRSRSARPALTAEVPPTREQASSATAASAYEPRVPPPAADVIELPDDPPKPRVATTPRRVPKHRSRPAGPSVTVRKAPY